MLDEFNVYLGENEYDSLALQKLLFIVGLHEAPDTAANCRMVCYFPFRVHKVSLVPYQILRNTYMNSFNVVESGGSLGQGVQTFATKEDVLHYS